MNYPPAYCSLSFLVEIGSEIEYFIYNRSDFHDRYLITNNCCVFPGSGIDIIKDGKTRKEGTWTVFRPYKKVNVDEQEGVFFFKIMQKKIATLKRWAEKSSNYSEERGIKNPLLHC